MKIRDDHMYHGAALIQIAEDARFTAINSLKVGATTFSSAYKINDHIAVYLKYAVGPHGPYNEYVFTFKSEHVSQLRKIAAANQSAHVALVCVEAREICSITVNQLHDLIDMRQRANGGPEDQYTILVTAEPRKSLRVYMNRPGRRGEILGRALVVSRSSFPDSIFE